ncbi:MAG: insulinase family protein [Spirochaetaceae bacterium]|jgi:Zn-dependent M16 (insulinase) family peptidase|nr:insulinase family protein [Spirochaetaceae bacterium]
MFDLLSREDVGDYASTGLHFRHRKTGLEVFHLLNSDEENLFAFAFRTPPSNSTGVAHILEHSVLCGSRRYPIRDPFARLAGQSMKTFLNALTYPDKTVYPAASPVETDYFNLMAVYGDAVFFPLLERWTFDQEAWRLEQDAAGRPSLQGVVYNEMKGAYSSLETIAARAAFRSVLEGTVYRHDSGGDPTEIPRLTYDAFRAFHRRYYRPDNCLLFLYGSIPTEKQLAFVEGRFLENANTTAKPRLPRTPAACGGVIDFPRCVAKAAPASPDSAGCTVLVNWFLGETAALLPPSASYMDLVFLWEVLAGHDGSPLTRALVESGLGEDFAPNCGLECDIKYLVMTAGLRGVVRKNAPKVEECIRDTLEKLAARGLHPSDIDAAIMSLDFANREITRAAGPYSLNLMRRVLRSWLYGGPPGAFVSTRDAFTAVKERLSANPAWLQTLIRELLLDNRLRTLVTVYPDNNYGKRRDEIEQAYCKKLLRRFGEKIHRPDGLPVGNDTDKRAESASGLADCIPHIKPADLTVRIDRIATVVSDAAGIPLFTNREAVNGIVYLDVAFPVDVLAPDDFPLLPFFATALTNTAFGGKTWAERAVDIGVTTGGLWANVFTSAAPVILPVGLPIAGTAFNRRWLLVRVKMLAEKTPAALDLLAGAIIGADFSDLQRLKDLALECRNDLNASIVQAGNEYAQSRSAMTFHQSKAVDELWNGLSQYHTMRRLAETPETLTAGFRRIRESLLDGGAIIHATADDEGLCVLEKTLAAFSARISSHGPRPPRLFFDDDFLRLARLSDVPRRPAAVEHYPIAGQVGFASLSFRSSPFGTPESAHEAVLAHWLSGNLLWERIRTIGGAYGAFAYSEPLERVFSLVSYRDPDPFRSLDVFEDCLKEAVSIQFDQDTVEKAVTGAYSREVQPRSPASRGFTGFVRTLYGITDELWDAKISALLATTGADITAAAQRLLASCQADARRTVLGQNNGKAASRSVNK